MKKNIDYEITDDLGNKRLVSLEDEKNLRILSHHDNNITFQYNNVIEEATILERSDDLKSLKISYKNHIFNLDIKNDLDQMIDKMGMFSIDQEEAGEVFSPMPGLVLDIKVNIGDEVKAGDPVITLEAMKMENLLQAPIAGTVKDINVKKGASVEKNQSLLLIE